MVPRRMAGRFSPAPPADHLRCRRRIRLCRPAIGHLWIGGDEV